MNRATLLTALLAPLALGATLFTGSAQAHGGDVSISVSTPDFGIRVGPPAYYRPAPVYVAPAPVYVAPPPVVYAPRVVYPAPVYAAPAPVYYGPPGHWKRHWKHHHRDWDD